MDEHTLVKCDLCKEITECHIVYISETDRQWGYGDWITDCCNSMEWSEDNGEADRTGNRRGVNDGGEMERATGSD